MTPMQMFAVALAYMIDADKVHETSERAGLIVAFGKMVARGEFTETGLADLVHFAFTQAKSLPIDDFLAQAAGALTPMQKASIYINALDVMLSDGKVVEAEQGMLKKIQDAFGLDRNTVLAIREVLYTKNDTRMFAHPEHPRNALDSFLRIDYRPSSRTE